MKRKLLYSKIVCFVFVGILAVGMIVNHIIPKALANLANGMSIPALAKQEEKSIADSFYKKDFFVTYNGLLHRVFGQRYMNEVVLLENGHGSALMNNCSDTVLYNNALAVDAFSKWCQSENRTFTFVQVPYKNSAGDSKLPIGVVDYSNDVADRFENYIIDLGVDYLDIRDAIQEEGLDFYSLFYKTEHHWNAYGGFFAFEQIATHMKEQYGDVVDETVLDINNYDCKVFEKMHSGHYGSRVGKIFIEPEDFFVLYPKFETKQTCMIPHRELTREGSFWDAVLESSYIEDTNVKGLYGTYIGGDYPLVIHESETAKTDKCVVMFIDSFGTVPESFLTTVYKKVIAVDLRWVLRMGWETTAKEYVEEYDADHVLVMLNPNQLIYENSEQFDYGI